GMRGGGIGWGLAATVGVKLALPQRPVVALTGDGSALYTIQALWTAAHERLSTVFVILNNRSYRILKQRTRAMRGHAAQTGNYGRGLCGRHEFRQSAEYRHAELEPRRARCL